MVLWQSAQRLYCLGQAFQTECAAEGCQSVAERVNEFLAFLDHEFDISNTSAGMKEATGKPMSSLQAQLKYQKRRRREAEHALEQDMNPRQGLRITSLWWVRAGLADPVVPAES